MRDYHGDNVRLCEDGVLQSRLRNIRTLQSNIQYYAEKRASATNVNSAKDSLESMRRENKEILELDLGEIEARSRDERRNCEDAWGKCEPLSELQRFQRDKELAEIDEELAFFRKSNQDAQTLEKELSSIENNINLPAPKSTSYGSLAEGSFAEGSLAERSQNNINLSAPKGTETEKSCFDTVTHVMSKIKNKVSEKIDQASEKIDEISKNTFGK